MGNRRGSAPDVEAEKNLAGEVPLPKRVAGRFQFPAGCFFFLGDFGALELCLQAGL